MKDRYRRGELAKEILTLFLVGGVVVGVATLPGLSHVFTMFGAKNTRERQRLTQSVRQLEKRGSIIRKIVNGKEHIALTDTGRKQLALHVIHDLAIPPQKRWDKKWRIVMFDIPDTKARERQIVSSKLKEMGMHPIQRSVFVSPYPCKNEIDYVMDFFHMRKHIVYLETDHIESNENLIKMFKLA